MKTLHTTITIQAPAREVWRHLVDFETHADWNPFFASIDGEPTVGSKLEVVVRKGEGTGMTFRPEVLVADPGRELRWKGKLAFGGLFDGTHWFLLSETDGVTTLEHGEDFQGILIPFMGKVLRETEDEFVAFNNELKRRVEASLPCPSA